MRSAPLPRRPRRSARWSPLRARVAHGTRADANRRLAIRVTGVGAAAMAVGWYLGPEDGLLPVLVLAGLGGWLGIRRVREVWKRRTVGRWIRRSVGETPLSLGTWRVAGSGYWLRPSSDAAAMPPPAPAAIAAPGAVAMAGPAPWPMDPPRALTAWPAAAARPLAAPSPPTFVAQPVAPLAVASTTFAAPTTGSSPVAPAASSAAPPDGSERPIFPWAPPREPWSPSAAVWAPASPDPWAGSAHAAPAGPAWGAPGTWPPPARTPSGVRHGPLWGPGVVAAPHISPAGGPGARWIPAAQPGGAPVPAAAYPAAAGASAAVSTPSRTVAGWPTTRVAPGSPWPPGGWTASPWIATSAGLGWRPPSSGVGPFQPGDEVELLATSTWIWVCGPRVERYARAAMLEVVGEDGLAITDGDAALRRWITLVPDEDDGVPWAVAQLAAAPFAGDPTAPAETITGETVAASDAPVIATETPDVTDAPLVLDGPASPPSDSVETGTPGDAPRRAAPRWDDPRSVIDDGRR